MVNLVHMMSAQWFACAATKHGIGVLFGFGIPCDVSWCDGVLNVGACAWVSRGGGLIVLYSSGIVLWT